MRWLSDGDTSTAARFSTSLRDMTARMFDLLCRMATGPLTGTRWRPISGGQSSW